MNKKAGKSNRAHSSYRFENVFFLVFFSLHSVPITRKENREQATYTLTQIENMKTDKKNITRNSEQKQNVFLAYIVAEMNKKEQEEEEGEDTHTKKNRRNKLSTRVFVQCVAILTLLSNKNEREKNPYFCVRRTRNEAKEKCHFEMDGKSNYGFGKKLMFISVCTFFFFAVDFSVCEYSLRRIMTKTKFFEQNTHHQLSIVPSLASIALT